MQLPRIYGTGLAVAAGTVLVGAASVAASPPAGDAVPAFWPYPATIAGAFALAFGIHAALTGRFQPTSVTATAAVVLAAMLATVPTLDYTLPSLGAAYILVGVSVVPAALGAAAKRQNHRLAAGVIVVVVGIGLAASLRDVHWSLPHRLAAHLVTSLPGALVGYALTARPR